MQYQGFRWALLLTLAETRKMSVSKDPISFSEPSSFRSPASRNLLEIQNVFWLISSIDGNKI